MSPDGSGNAFCFLLPEVLEGNKKEKNCSGQRDQEYLWNAKRLLLKKLIFRRCFRLEFDFINPVFV